MKNFCITLLLSVLLSNSILAQPLLNNIPKGVGIVVEINLNSLKTNLGDRISTLDKKFNFPMLNGTSIPVNELLDGSISGVNTSEKAYFFMDGENSIWLLPINDATLFKQTVMKNFNSLDEDSPMPKFTKDKGSEIVYVQNHGVTIKDGIAVISKGPYINSYEYGYNNSYTYKEELKDFMRKEGITNEDDFVSPLMQKRIKELARKAEQEQIKKEIEEKKQEEEREKEREKRREERENAEEVVESESITEEASEVVAADEAVYDEIETVEESVEVVADEAEAMAMEEEYEEPYYYNWDHAILQAFDEEMEKNNKRRENRMYEVKKVEMVENTQSYLNLKSSNSIASNAEFKKKFSSTHDLGVYMDASYPLSMQGGSRLYRNLGFKTETMKEILEGNVNVFYMDVKDNAIEITGDQFVNERFSKYETIKTGAVNKNFLKYLPAKTFGMAAMNLDMNEAYAMSFDMYSSMLSAMDIEEGVDVSGVLDMVDMFINKDMLLNTFSGDALLAVTGTSQFIGTKRTYEYDTNTYRSTMKTVPDTSTIPEIMAFFTIKNQENFAKFLAALDKLKVIKKANGVYVIDMKYGYESEEEKGLKSMWTMGFEGDMFYITNSSEAKQKNALQVRNESANLDPAMLNLLNTNGNSMYYDHKAGINEFPMDEMDSRNTAGMLQLSTKYFHKVNMSTTKVANGHYKLKSSFSFNEENRANALLQILDWMEEMDDNY